MGIAQPNAMKERSDSMAYAPPVLKVKNLLKTLCVPVCTGELTRQNDGECGCAGRQEKKEE